MNKEIIKRCEGWRRYGGAFSFGTPRWKQCQNIATVILTVIQKNKREEMPSCNQCWDEARSNNEITIVNSKPII